MSFFNPVLETYRGRPVRKYNTLRIRVSQEEFKKFIDAKELLGYSEREAIQRTRLLCEKCETISVQRFNG